MPDDFFGVPFEEAIYKLMGQVATALGVVDGSIDGQIIDGPEELVLLASRIKAERDQALRSVDQKGFGPYTAQMLAQFMGQFGDAEVPKSFLKVVAGTEIEDESTKVKFLTEHELLQYALAIAMRNNEQLIEHVKRAEITLSMQGKSAGGLVLPGSANRAARRQRPR